MEFGFYPTPPPLAAAVKAVWYARGTKAEFDVPEPIVPDGCVELVLNLADRFVQMDAGGSLQPRELLVGQMTRPTVASPTGDVDLLGIRFWPGRAGAVLRTPMWELQDHLIAASSVLPEIQGLADDLRGLPPGSRLARLTEVLAPYCARVAPDRLRSVDAALTQIATTHGMLPIDGLAKRTGVTRRHLERQFRDQVGLRVKQVARTASRRLAADEDQHAGEQRQHRHHRTRHHKGHQAADTDKNQIHGEKQETDVLLDCHFRPPIVR